MLRQPEISSMQSCGLQFRFLCFLREETNGNTVSRRNSFFVQWIFLIAVLILIQYSYNFTYYCQPRSERDEVLRVASHSTEATANETFVFAQTYHHHQRVLSYKRFMAMNYRFIDLGKNELPEYYENTPICQLNLTSLGPIKVNKKLRSLRWDTKQFERVRQGGFYAPLLCRARHKVAILVPYRNREANLAVFLNHIHPLLQKQLLQYRIFVIEQYGQGKFNKGALYNVAYLETQKFGVWHCFIFHDVDLIPQDERILYSCPRKPTHMSPAVESMNYRYTYNHHRQ